MDVKVGNTAAKLQWPSFHHHRNQLRRSSMSPKTKTRCNLVFWVNIRSPFVGTTGSSSGGGLFGSKSVGHTNMILPSPPPSSSSSSSMRRSSSSKMFDTSFCASKDDDNCNEEENEFIRKLQDLKTKTVTKKKPKTEPMEQSHENEESDNELSSSSSVDTKPPRWFGINKSMTHGNYQLLSEDISDHFVVRNASTVDIPMSLRMIKKKRKKMVEEASRTPSSSSSFSSSSSSCCTYYYDSVKKAFSSMVFTIRELHSYILQLREVLLLENEIDTHNLLSEVHKEMHASFCWLLQQIFSCTPTLMVPIMLLLANFTVHSMATATKKHKARMDREILLRMVAPASIQNFMNDLEDELLYDQTSPEYFQTDLIYQEAVRDNPENGMYLCNYAQFLYMVVNNHDRAEQYFKQAVEVTPFDAENLSKYANFLWMAKKNLCAAEEMYLNAIEIDPDNTSHASNYANFLWNTDGEDTYFPLQA